MSLHFSANQFEDAYLPHRLGNWQVPKSFPERPVLRQGFTKPVANQSGRQSTGPRNGRKFGTVDTSELRFQSAPLPQKSGKLFVTGSAVASAKPARLSKGFRNKQGSDLKPNQALNSTHEGPEYEKTVPAVGEDTEETPPVYLGSSRLPESPHKAAIILAARQKKHRPLADLNEELGELLKPPGSAAPSAVTIETGKAKGPTSCTKKKVLQLLKDNDGNPVSFAVNLMELAIKWDSKTPPSSAKKLSRVKSKKPVQKTLDWLYERPNEGKTIDEIQCGIVSSPSQRKLSASMKQESAKSRDSGISIRSSRETSVKKSVEDSEPESGYGTPRSDTKRSNESTQKNCDLQENKVNKPCDLERKVNELRDLEKINVKRMSSPPKNHFVVSSAFRDAKLDASDSVLPEYPLQIRSPLPQRRVASSSKVTPLPSPKPRLREISEYPPQRVLPELYHEEEEEPLVHSQCDRDSGFSDDAEATEPSRQSVDKKRSRSRPCVACDWAAESQCQGQGHRSGQQEHQEYKAAFKAGTTPPSKVIEPGTVVRRRQDFRAPKPRPLNAYPRYVRGTLVPPFATFPSSPGNHCECPDFKRMISTYKLAFASNKETTRNQKTLTKVLNEKVNKLWR